MKKIIILLFSILWLFGCSTGSQLFPKDPPVPAQDKDLEQLLERAEGARAWDGATNFPGALDDDATLYDVEDDSTIEDEHHDALAQATIAIQTKIGTGADTPAATDVFVGTGAGTSGWEADIPTAVTIGTKYIYRVDGTDVLVLDGGTGVSDLADLNLSDFTNDLDAQDRFTQDVTVQTFGAADATPDVTNGGSKVVQFWRSVDATTITDFDDTDDHSEFVDGDTFLLIFNSAQVIDCSDNGNIKGHGNNDYTGAAGEWALVVWDATNSYWVFKPSETKIVNFNTLRIPNDEAADGTLANLGEIHIRGDEDRFSLHAGAGGEIAGEVTKSMLDMISVNFNPELAFDTDTQVFLFEVHADLYPNGIIIDEWKISCNVDPDVEPDLDLKRCTAWIGLGGAAVVDVLDTANGIAAEDTDANINGDGSAIAAGQFLYLEFDADPAGTCDQMNFSMIFHAEED